MKKKNTEQTNILQLGIVGGFQNGKSTLINCLLGNRVAVSGSGLSTTKQVIRYRYTEFPCIFVQKKNGKKLLPIAQYNDFLSDLSTTYFEVGFPCDLLKQVEIWDTPGFNAEDRDDKVTTECLDKLDCVLFLLGGSKGGLNDAEKDIFHKICSRHLPHIVVFNSQAAVDMQWIPQSDDNLLLRQTTAAQMSQMEIFSALSVTESRILPVNTAWFWYDLLKHNSDKNDFLLPQTAGEKQLMMIVESYLTCMTQVNRDILGILSNINTLKDFLQKDSLCFGNLHTMVELHQNFHSIRQAFNKITQEEK